MSLKPVSRHSSHAGYAFAGTFELGQ